MPQTRGKEDLWSKACHFQDSMRRQEEVSAILGRENGGHYLFLLLLEQILEVRTCPPVSGAKEKKEIAPETAVGQVQFLGRITVAQCSAPKNRTVQQWTGPENPMIVGAVFLDKGAHCHEILYACPGHTLWSPLIIKRQEKG